MITLLPRLAAVAGYVLPGNKMADIGTDHGYLPGYLVESGRVPGAIAADVNQGPLEVARQTAAEFGLQDRIELRLGNGLKVLQPGEAATVTICGMGGALISEILEAGSLDGIRRLVMQPNNGEERLRLWLQDNHWRLIAEQLVAEAGRLYAILVAEPGEMALSPAEAMVGPFLLKENGPLLVSYVQILSGQTRRALAGASRSERSEARLKADDLAQRHRLLEEVLSRAGDHSR